MNYNRVPLWLLIEELKNVVNCFAEGLDEMNVVSATQSTCSNAEACPDKIDGTFGTRLKSTKRVKDVREGKK